MTCGFVLDASVAASWAFPDEGHPSAQAALQHLERSAACAPALWWFELRNTLVVNQRRGRIAVHQTAGFLAAVAQLPVVLDRAPESDRTLELARAGRLSVYDAAYLELALRLRLPLATLDQALAAAARAAGVPLLAAPGT
ncbi:MAG TPA: type II toxin-antitoxin system VapC family toxin [Terriglobales bacterium]|nr:type II toxin-antitoxin system VapC family toxin [Terriglobales bacterium]